MSTNLNWTEIRDSIPSTAHDLLSDLEKAAEEDAEDPARAIERMLRSRIASIKQRFEELRGEGADD